MVWPCAEDNLMDFPTQKENRQPKEELEHGSKRRLENSSLQYGEWTDRRRWKLGCNRRRQPYRKLTHDDDKDQDTRFCK